MIMIMTAAVSSKEGLSFSFRKDSSKLVPQSQVLSGWKPWMTYGTWAADM